MRMQWAAPIPPPCAGPAEAPPALGRRPRGPRTWGRGMGAAHCMRIGIYIYIYIYRCILVYMYICIYLYMYIYIIYINIHISIPYWQGPTAQGPGHGGQVPAQDPAGERQALVGKTCCGGSHNWKITYSTRKFNIIDI